MSAPPKEPGLTYVNVTRDEADAMLAAAAPGSYLIRPSSQGTSTFSLSYKHRQSLKHGHILMKHTPDGWTTDGVPAAFPALRSLLKRLPFGLRVDDDSNMASASSTASSPSANYGTPHSNLPAAAGYATPQLEPNANASGGYGKVPLSQSQRGAQQQQPAVDANGYGRAPVAASSTTGDYALLAPTAPAYAALQPTAPAEVGGYGRVPAGENATPGADAYGRVPASAAYQRLNPTAAPTNASSPALTQRSAGGYGRVPLSEAAASSAAALPNSGGGAVPGSPAGERSQVATRRNLPAGAASPQPSTLTRTPSAPSAVSPNMAARSGYAGAPAPVSRPAALASSGSMPTPAAAAAAPAPASAAMSARSQAHMASGAVSSSPTVNLPQQLAMQALQLMQGHESLAGHERFLRAQIPLLVTAKQKATTSQQVFMAMVRLGNELGAYVAQIRAMLKLSGSELNEAIQTNHSFQQHYVSIQLQARELKSLCELGAQFQNAISSELGHQFWVQRIGLNNSISWSRFFGVLQEALGMNMQKIEVFLKYMFDCNNENVITAQSFNMFIHWFDYEGMRPPVTVKDFLLILIARAELVFFFEGFHGVCSREQSEKILANRPPKSYMIRLSDSSAGVFILSYVDSKFSNRHRLLNQVDKQGFMVEQSTYNTLPELITSRPEALLFAVPNATAFETPAESIYGGGADFYEQIAASATALLKVGEVAYHAKIVLNRSWIQVRLEVREAELLLVTNKSPLRRAIGLPDITDCAVCPPPLGTSYPCFRVVAAGQTHVFACADPQEWVKAVQTAAADHRRQNLASATSANERTAEERLAQQIATRRADLNDDLADLRRAMFNNRRRPGDLSPFDVTLIRCVNAALAKALGGKKGAAKGAPAPAPPQLAFSKLDLDLNLRGEKCEVEVPMRDTVVVRNDGGQPVELHVDSMQKESHTLKFVPNHLTLQPGQSEELHVTLLVQRTAIIKELVHVSVGAGRGVASLFFVLNVSSKMMESLVFEEICFGPRLGAGAFGQVFGGSYKGRQVAIKAVGFEPDFDQELNILRELRPCPAIIEYIGSCKRVPFQGFIVLEFMALGSLDKYIHDLSFHLTLQYTLRVAQDVAQGLAHLHRAKIMHLDMKPANVLVAALTLEADTCVKLADFGLSQSRDSAASFKGDYVEGTLLYMAPEMLREKLFSQKGDIFSFGMTMWETLKREQPYSGEKHRKLKKAEFEEVRERGELPGELTEIEPIEVRELLSKMLSLDHEARPTADDCTRLLQIVRAKLSPTL
jgi:hypothetical protein